MLLFLEVNLLVKNLLIIRYINQLDIILWRYKLESRCFVDAASTFSRFIIGLGLSAVSQAIAQRIAVRDGVNPDSVAIWEDDQSAYNVSSFRKVTTSNYGLPSLQLLSTFTRHRDNFLPTKVISFVLYGNSLKYTEGAVRNAELCQVIFDGWICRFYIGENVPAKVVLRLQQLGAEVPLIPTKYFGYYYFVRFLVAGDSSVDTCIVRDTVRA